MTRTRGLLLSLSLCCAACGAEVPDLPDDAGSTTDSGVALDAGASTDGGGATDAGAPDAGAPDAGPGDAGAPDAGTPASDAGTPDAGLACPAGLVCVDRFVFTHGADTRTAPRDLFDRYSCAPTIDESGSEVVYRVEVPADGFLSAAVTEASGVDVDVHILSALDAQACVARGNFHAKADVTAGTWFVVVDTFASGGVPQAGTFSLDLGFVQPSVGPCALNTGVMNRVGDNGNALPMPATGPVVMEAHLVTQAEPQPYPATSTDELAAHYALSQQETGFVMHRAQVWAPMEGGTFFGAGIGSPTVFPVVDEGWYVNMYWTSASRPARSTRMILRVPNTSRAVVVSAGYETGPGDLLAVGGTGEETHFYLGTQHRSTLTLGIATDQALPFGPRVCTP